MKKIVKYLYKIIPYYSHLGFEIEKIEDGNAVFKLKIRNDLTQNGTIHGGALASLVDSSCACAAFSLIFPHGYVTTIDLQVQYLRPASEGYLTSKARCLKSGKSIYFCEARVEDEKEKLICTGSAQLLRVDLNKK